MVNVTYRAIEKSDATALKAIQDALFPGHWCDYAAHSGHSNAPGFVAIQDGNPIGFVSAITVGADSSGENFWQHVRPYVRFIGVQQGSQRHGVGKALLDRMCDFLRQNIVARQIYLECDRENVGFFEKCSFREMSADELFSLAGKRLKSRVPLVFSCTDALRHADVL